MTPRTKHNSYRAAEDDRGVVIILVALTMVAIMVMVALVLDLSVVRQTRQSNKSSADFAMTAGLHGLETSEGIPRPWGGVCSAIEFLKANHEDLSGLTGTYSDGDGTSISPNPCTDKASSPYIDFCTPNDTDTWAWFHASMDGGRIVVDIKSGYLMPDPAFAEDSGPYSSDNAGDPLQGGCDQLAVIINERDGALFGGAAQTSGYDTAIRSVGRVKIGSLQEETVALLLLEDRDCMTLETSGNNTYVRVRATPVGAPTKPGLIHSNSNASGDDCGGSGKVLAGSDECAAVFACAVDGPSIVAENASSLITGRVGVRALGGTAAQQADASTPSCADASAPTAGCTVSPVPVNRGVVTRAPVDVRYLAHARNLKTTAAAAGPAGAFPVPNTGACNALNDTVVSTTTTGGLSKVYLNCDLTVSNGATVVFDDTITDVIINGSLDVKGTFVASNIRNLYVQGSGGVIVSGAIRINERDRASCLARFSDYPRDQVTKFVVLDGPFDTGTANAEVDLCNTFLFLANGALPTSNGTPPSNNGYNGRINVGASASLDWKAPNQSDLALSPGDPLFADFEDLALWTEFSGNGSAGTAAGIGGQGEVLTTGVFFLPNANPFNISGGGSGAKLTADAQFIVRKLRLSGTVALEMAPNPNDSVPTPVFEGFGMVR